MKERLYTQAELVSFGNYLLSERRDQTITIKDNLREVHEEDIANWGAENPAAPRMIDAIFIGSDDEQYIFAFSDNEVDRDRLLELAQAKVEEDEQEALYEEVYLNEPINE